MTEKLVLILCLSLTLLTACETQAPTSVLAAEAYTDPQGLFSIAYPEGWQYSHDPEADLVTFSPIEQEDTQNPLAVMVYAVPTAATTVDASGEEAKALLEEFLKQNLDESYQVYSSGDTTVDHQAAAVIDFGKPIEGGYASGRIVLIYSPGYAVGFLGSAQQETWEEFLPTFRTMLAEFHFFPVE
jgi:hypothetical protein